MAGGNYKNGKIYCIRNNINDDIYVGSTVTPLSKRMSVHRADAISAKKKHRPLYTQMNDLGFDEFDIELIEECPCDNLEQLLRTEGKYIRQMATLNIIVSGQTRNEYYANNRGHISDNKKNTINRTRREKMNEVKHIGNKTKMK